MKRFTLSNLLVLFLGCGLYAGTPPVFVNHGVINNPFTNIVATTFINDGVFNTYAISNLTVTTASDTFSFLPFATHQTFYYTNSESGTMIGQPGFNFFAQTSTGNRSAASFSDSGLIQDYDVEAVPDWIILGGGPAILSPGLAPGVNANVPSITEVLATNINVDGTMQVGDGGRLTLSGKNVTINRGTLIAGTVDELDPSATLGRGTESGIIQNNITYWAFSPPNDVYDIYWGVTNKASLTGDVDDIAEVGLFAPTEVVLFPEYPLIGTRNGVLNDFFAFEVCPLNGNPDNITGTTFSAANYTPSILTVPGTSNTTYVTIVFLNNSFTDTNMSAEVGFIPFVGIASEAMVKFSAPVLDVVTGATVTNAVYLLDTGALEGTNYNMTNCVEHAFARPLSFEITRTEPVEWVEWTELQGLYPISTVYDPTIIDGAGEFKSDTVPMNTAVYAAQIGRNPERADGLFPFTEALLGTSSYDMPDLTNEPGRIEINAGNLNLTGAVLRGNGVATINATSLTGLPAAADFGSFNSDLGNIKSAITVSNVYPTSYHRVLGDVLVWSVDWSNTQTNDGAGNKVTNNFVYHMLVVDQDLRSTFTPSALNLALRGNNVVVSDPLNVVGSAVFQAANLVLNSSLNLTGKTPQLLTSNMPGLKNLTVGPSGSISADIQINLGVALTSGHINPATAPFTISSITNLGDISSGSIQLQTQQFANGGTVFATNGGEILINSKTNLLNAGLGFTNLLKADAGISLYSVVIQATNSTILAGQGGVGQLTLYASGQLTDFYPNTASTNAYTTNFWEATAGFSLLVKPTTGDLFGTKITTIAARANQVARHYWAGQDLGASAAGFFNNVVIGHLVIDRTSPTATLRFSGTGAKNAMYVDFLDLEDLSFSDYHNGLVVDPNLTIYFASANVDPSKLSAAHPNIVWVPQFAGPNSTKVVQYKNGGTCLMNATLATSSDISSDFSGIPNSKNPFPLDNPSAYVGAIPCPSSVTSADVLNLTNNGVPQVLAIWTTGQGSITPVLKSAKVGQSVVLTAVPAPGWTFLSWSGGVTATQPTISFVIPATNAVLTANFVVNPLPSLAGTYNGLFYQSSGLTASSSGAVTFTVSSAGASSGKLTIGTAVYPFTAQFFGSGQATAKATNGANVLTVTLQLDTAKLSDQATGTVSGSNWTAALTADRAPVWTSANPAPQAGYYTAILPGDPNNAAASPGGDSYAMITVTSAGNLSAVGALADGASFSQSVPVSKEGQWPLYFSATGGQSLLGWVTFTANQVAGKVNWIKVAGSGPYYTNGFNTNTFLQGDKYVAPTGQTSGLNFTNANITLSGGNLAVPVADAVKLTGGVTYQTADKTTLTLTITPKTGGFTAQYLPPGGGQKIPILGVILPNEQVGRGFFLGTNQSGEILLQGQ